MSSKKLGPVKQSSGPCSKYSTFCHRVGTKISDEGREGMGPMQKINSAFESFYSCICY